MMASKRHDVLAAAAAYAVVTVGMTWPLAAGLARDVPGDLGDALLNMWILGWGAETLPRIVTGHASVADWWNANIFHPEPLALAFSEHLFAEVLQILPVYHLTHNLILSYNLLFLSTFVLSGCGMYLLAREITGDRAAAFVAGLIYAFVPFRVAQIAHIQSLSSQWMPFVLYGFRHYVTTRQRSALVLGGAALLLQNWSCGYYLIFFAPFVVLFVVHQIAAAGHVRDVKLWIGFALAAAVVAAGTWPFLSLYLAAQGTHGLERPLPEIMQFSADVYSYLTAPEALRLLGSVLRAWPKPEGELFLGLVPALLALVAVSTAISRARHDTTGSGRLFRVDGARDWLTLRALVTLVLGTLALALAAAAIAVILSGGFVTSVAGIPLRATNVVRLLGQLAIVVAALILLSGKFRAVSLDVIASPAGIALLSAILAAWLSLGPSPRARGVSIAGMGLYGVLLDHVPGFDGLRVPARYAMVVALYLSMLAAVGAAWIVAPAGARPRRRWAIAVALCAAFLGEAAFAPMYVNQTWGDSAVVPPPRVEPASRAPAVYRQLRLMPDARVIAEFPFGDPAWELRYVYYSTVHWKRILNGYSGGFPLGYKVRVARLQRIVADPEGAWGTLIEAGTTHAIVHEAAMPAGDAGAVAAWLRAHGAREIGRFGDDVLFELDER